MNIIQRNFFRLLRSGAFDNKESIEPMSAFKWRRLFQMVEVQNVVSVFVQGANKLAIDEGMNLPQDLIEAVNKKLTEENTQKPFEDEDIQLSSRILNRRLKRIIEKEMKNDDMSIETVDLLEIIIFNVNKLLNNGISLDGIIRLGKYLRKRGDKVDFVKLETWLNLLHMERMAQLQGSILMEVFGFEQDELPFVQKEEKEAFNLVMRSISNLAKDTAEVWHFRQSRTGFVQNNSKILRRNVRRSVRYYPYAPLETTCSFFTNLGRSLSEIEE
ncbi:MAG: hypothetical protein IJV27_03620 [Prevotella sp.]|nr:hypothetical protein [Prevotella sp.]